MERSVRSAAPKQDEAAVAEERENGATALADDPWPVPRQEVLGTRDGFMAHVEDIAANVALSSVASLPPALRAPIVSGVARLGRRFDKRHTEAARRFLTQAFGELPEDELEARVLQAWRHFLTVVLETQGFDRNVPAAELLEHYDVELCERARELSHSGTGCIFVTAHIGNWEAAAALAPRLGFAPFYAIAKPPRNRPLSRRIQRVREGRRVRLLPRRGAMKDAPAILAAGGTLGMLLDQRALTKPVYAPFFGRPARCDRSAGVLIRRLRAPVLIAACYRTEEPYRYKGVIPTVLTADELEGQSPEEISTRINQELEALILAAPEQYFWLHDRYRE